MSKNNKKNYLRVLSIDFDYFQTVDANTLRRCYPDGVDLPTSLSVMAWSSYYANPDTERLLYDVEVDYDEIELMQKLLQEQDKSLPVLIAKSHKKIYEFIVSQMECIGYENLYVTNVDMHHDYTNNNAQLDCGNWISHLEKKYCKDDKSFGLEWIANPISKEMYGLCKVEGSEHIKTSLADIRARKYDAVFLCRSDNWLPPHLDINFNILCNTMARHFKKVLCEKGVLDIREYEELVQQKRELIEKVFKRKDVNYEQEK